MQLYRSVYRLDYRDHEQHLAEFLERLQELLDESRKRPLDLDEVMGCVTD